MPMIFGVISLLLMIGALVDIIPKDDSQIRHLPKFVWIILVVLVPPVGAIIWFIIGHEYAQRTPQYRAPAPRPTQAPHSSMSSTEEQLAALEREIEESEKADRIRKLEAELAAKKRKKKNDA